MALIGNEVLQVVGIAENGIPAGISQRCTTQDIANLASGGGSGRIVTVPGDVQILSNDAIVKINKTIPENTNVILPQNPINWRVYTVTDGAGNCATYPITITGLGIMNQNTDSRDFFFDGTNWSFK